LSDAPPVPSIFKCEASVTMADEEDSFWLLTDLGWPSDTEDYVFLGRAVERIGAAIFPSQWTGLETAANRFRDKRLPGPPPQSIQSALEDVVDPNPAYRRFLEVQKVIVDAAVAGKLITVGRDVAGGDMSQPFPASYWHTENWRWRFRLCRTNPAEPFAARADGSKWIFVERRSLDEFIRELQPPAPSSTIKGKTDCKNWLRAQMAASPERKRKPKRDYLREAKELFAVSKQSFNRAWAEAQNETGSVWSKPGRPKST
jgi:hypothetical protein